ncbi:uncharacterized protein [Anoplolepis gracilipes]|uniref:uncharacterized protein n=1 Tax=Anoplolepis gracilipes TaxID=354296 RepID=UPI003BA1F379
MQQQQQEFLQRQQQEFLREQQREMAANTAVQTGVGAEPGIPEHQPRQGSSSGSSPTQGRSESQYPGSSIQWIALQIPEFGNTKEENVLTWVRRVEKVSLIHGASDSITLLAALSRLVNPAKKWYEVQTGEAMESWIGLRQALTRMFERQVPFYKMMQKIEARKWNQAKETFDQYVVDKVSLTQRLNLSVKDTINLIIGGIIQSSLRAVALSINTETLEEFLDKMRKITEGISDLDWKQPPSRRPKKRKRRPAGTVGKRAIPTRLAEES